MPPCLMFALAISWLLPQAFEETLWFTEGKKIGSELKTSDGEIGKPIGPERIPIARIQGTEVDLELKLWKS